MPAQSQARRRVKLVISQDAMSVSLIVPKLKESDPQVTFEEIMSELQAAHVVIGVDEDAIRACLADGTVNTPVRIAIGKKPKRGEDAQFTYHFDTSLKHAPQVDEDGHVDYYNINSIQNTTAGAVLVTKTPPGPGQAGQDVFGKEIAGTPGRDLPFKFGDNVKVSDDGMTLIAAADGAVQYRGGKVTVADILTIRGDVDFSVGNIDCRGSVKVAGDIKAGFSVKVDGNLEVGGNVEDCTIECGGSILIKGGLISGGNGNISAEADISFKFAEGQTVTAGGNVFAAAEIINCQVTAGDLVQVTGRNGKIVGGEIRAGKTIRAPIIGSEAGTTTALTVGYDPQIMARHHELTSELGRLDQDSQRVKEALYNLHRLDLDGKLTPEKRQVLKKLQAFQKDLPENERRLKEEKHALEERLKEMLDARIIAEEVLYPGVRATFGIICREILEERPRCSLSVEAGRVMISDFRE